MKRFLLILILILFVTETDASIEEKIIQNFDKIKNELNFSTKFLAEDGIEEMVKILEDGNFDLEQSNV